MTREEEKYQAANNAWNIRGLTNQEQKIPYKLGFLEGFDYADQHQKEGLWDAEKVCDFIEENIDNYIYINRDWNTPQIKSNFIEDLRKAMEDYQ